MKLDRDDGSCFPGSLTEILASIKNKTLMSPDLESELCSRDDFCLKKTTRGVSNFVNGLKLLKSVKDL